MSTGSGPLAPRTPMRLTVRRRRRAPWWVLFPVALGLAVLGARALQLRPADLWARTPWAGEDLQFPTLLVDQGLVSAHVVESGVVESANNAVVKCEVEAMAGVVTSGGSGGGRGGGGSSSGGSSASSSSGGSGGAAGGVTGGGSGGSMASGAGGAGGASGQGGSGGGGSGAASISSGSGVQKPQIRSFSFTVKRHTPLRPSSGGASSSRFSQQSGGSGSGDGSDFGERSGSTRILSILPEGQRVSAGEIVCELDSATFRDLLRDQEIRVAQAQSWVEQAEKVLEVSEIELKEYVDGIYDQDRLLIQQYIQQCRTQLDKTRAELEWSIKAAETGLVSPSQVRASRFGLQRSELALREALGMERRLENFAKARIIRELEAKIESVKSDLYAQQAAYRIEEERLERLKLNIERCTLRAPRDGIIVYVNEVNRWGRTDTQIQEGTTVREGQAIFQVPDPTRMLVKANINESKVSDIHVGQPALIRIDAFPDRPLQGTVREVTAIPQPASGFMSDVKVYAAIVHIDAGGFVGLRPGMSAEVTFFGDERQNAVRLPRQSIRRVGDVTFAAVATADEPGYRWVPLELGLIGPIHAEVQAGLKPGDRVVANPQLLPSPPRSAIAEAQGRAAATVASAGPDRG